MQEPVAPIPEPEKASTKICLSFNFVRNTANQDAPSEDLDDDDESGQYASMDSGEDLEDELDEEEESFKNQVQSPSIVVLNTQQSPPQLPLVFESATVAQSTVV